MKRAFSVLVCAAMIFSLTACGEDPVSDGKDAPEGDAAASGKLAVITGTGGLGDQNLNDYVYSGVKMHEAEGVTVDVVQPSDLADFPNLQTLYAEEGTYSTIVCIGFDQKEALTTVSKEFPDQSFIICDTECEGSNVTSVVFRAEETGFQLGVLAGLLVREGALENSRGNNTIGFVGGSDIATINQFAAGYEAGARLVNPDVTVLRSYVGSFSDPTTATELATSLYEQGADIVFACAGGSGLGVFTAAEKQNGYALGIETNQNALSPDCIIASGTRAWDEAIYDATQKALDGTLESGLLSYGISDGMLQAERADSNVPVSDEIMEEVAAYSQRVADGSLKLPTTLEEVDSFLAEYAE